MLKIDLISKIYAQRAVFRRPTLLIIDIDINYYVHGSTITISAITVSSFASHPRLIRTSMGKLPVLLARAVTTNPSRNRLSLMVVRLCLLRDR